MTASLLWLAEERKLAHAFIGISNRSLCGFARRDYLDHQVRSDEAACTPCLRRARKLHPGGWLCEGYEGEGVFTIDGRANA